MRYHLTKQLTLGGLTAALAVVIMCLVGMLGITTYVCPALCMLLLSVLVKLCSSRVCWCWYVVVCILSLLLAPDKEAAAVFAFLGYYPILCPWINQRKFPFVWKMLIFNTAISAMYWMLLNIVGLAELTAEVQELEGVFTVVLLLLGNITFFLLDMVLGKIDRRR